MRRLYLPPDYPDQLVVQRVQVRFVAQAGRERFQGLSGVVLAAVEAPVYEGLDASPQWVKQCCYHERGDDYGELRLLLLACERTEHELCTRGRSATPTRAQEVRAKRDDSYHRLLAPVLSSFLSQHHFTSRPSPKRYDDRHVVRGEETSRRLRLLPRASLKERQRAWLPYASNSGPRDAAKILRNALSPPAPGMRKLGWAKSSMMKGTGRTWTTSSPYNVISAKIPVEVSSDQDWSRRKLPTP